MQENICPITNAVCNEASVFFIEETLGNKKRSIECCRRCAGEAIRQSNAAHAAFESKKPSQGQFMTAQEFIQSIFGGIPTNMEIYPKVKTCPACHSSLAEIKAMGDKLGCPECYKTFAEELGPTMSYLYGNNQTHVGKAPLAFQLAGKSKEDQIAILQKALDVAVGKEDYERAAKFRDMLNKIKES